MSLQPQEFFLLRANRSDLTAHGRLRPGKTSVPASLTSLVPRYMKRNVARPPFCPGQMTSQRRLEAFCPGQKTSLSGMAALGSQQKTSPRHFLTLRRRQKIYKSEIAAIIPDKRGAIGDFAGLSASLGSRAVATAPTRQAFAFSHECPKTRGCVAPQEHNVARLCDERALVIGSRGHLRFHPFHHNPLVFSSLPAIWHASGALRAAETSFASVATEAAERF